MDYSRLGSPVHGICQERIPECVYMPSFRGSSWSKPCLLSLLHWQKDSLSFFFNWKIIALQTFVVFCKPQYESAIGVDISPPFWNSLPSPSPSHHSRLILSSCLSFLSYTANSRWLSFTYDNVSFHVTLSIHLTLSSPFPMSISLFSMSVQGIAAL